MMDPFPYREQPPAEKPSPREFALPLLRQAGDPTGYLPDPGLTDAVNVALILRQPLLVTGEPGTGKSQLAASVAYQLGLDPPLAFETKSTTVARDLFYMFDNIGRFRAAQTAVSPSDPRLFISFNALGDAIVKANEESAVKPILPDSYQHGGMRRSVVLIDEIDKAPRDFPNDILNEIERLFFRIPELGGVTVAVQDESYRPIVVMTSNSEKSLPDAFLRRCIFYNIPFPDDERLERIVLSRLGDRLTPGVALLRDAIRFFGQLRDEATGLRKRPGTAELLNWVAAMIEFGCEVDKGIKPQSTTAARTLNALSKIAEDQPLVLETFRVWLRG
jgi:MoxR-like ATPase